MTFFKYFSKTRHVLLGLIILFVLIFNAKVRAQDNGWGLGVIIGEPTGISAKNWLTRTTALDFAAAWSFEGEDSFSLHADYLVHHFNLFPVEAGVLPIYYGFGGKLKFEDNDSSLGARFPVGINYHLEDAPLDVFLEIVPVMELVPETDFKMNGAIGVRFFFD